MSQLINKEEQGNFRLKPRAKGGQKMTQFMPPDSFGKHKLETK